MANVQTQGWQQLNEASPPTCDDASASLAGTNQEEGTHSAHCPAIESPPVMMRAPAWHASASQVFTESCRVAGPQKETEGSVCPASRPPAGCSQVDPAWQTMLEYMLRSGNPE